MSRDSSSGSVPMATNLGHSHQGQTHSRLSVRDSRPPVSAKSANNDRVEPPPQESDMNIQDIGNSNCGHVCHSQQNTSSPVYVSDSGASNSGDRCSVTGLAGEVPPAQQSHSETKDHPQGRGNSNRWPSQPWFPHLLRLCVDHPCINPYRRDQM